MKRWNMWKSSVEKEKKIHRRKSHLNEQKIKLMNK